jgi:hypothetical protein
MITFLLWVRLLFLALCGGLVTMYLWIAYRTRDAK